MSRSTWRRALRRASKALADGRYDILCFSLELGDMRGTEFYREAQKRRLAGGMPALMLAATPDKKVFDDAIAAGITDCFPKAELEDLERYVEQWERRANRRMSGHVLLVEDSDTAANFCIEVIARPRAQWSRAFARRRRPSPRWRARTTRSSSPISCSKACRPASR